DEGKSAAQPSTQPAEEQSQAQRTIQASPGDVGSSRPVSEPTDTTTQR
ncbi:twin-arginine translocase TatA/TatE family subunit, partial [Streptomyces sp. NPDC004012]